MNVRVHLNFQEINLRHNLSQSLCFCVYVIVPINPINALALIQTRHAGTFVDVDLAVEALETFHALTSVHGDVIVAGGTILAGLRLALIDLRLTVNPYRGWQ